MISEIKQRKFAMKMFASALVVMLIASCGWAAGKGPAYATPEEAQKDPDFAYQGEYAGKGLGVQVIALSGGQFRAVKFQGGLPGAGWDGSEKTSVEGDREAIDKVIKGLEKQNRKSPTLGAEPVDDAVELFDGTEASVKEHWKPGAQLTEDGLLMQGITSIDTFQDFHLHVEFRLPYMPEARGQARGNSGLYLQGRYEVQMLDSFGLEGKDNECGGIYKAAPPKVNMAFPPLAWQTYDVDFTAAKFNDAGEKTANAVVTVRHNGVVIHENLEIPGKTPGGPVSTESSEPGPVFLQNHGDPVRYRNIWAVRK